MSTILGIDPGAHTGVARIEDGQLVSLQTIAPHEIERTIREAAPDRVVFEDSRLQSHIWTKADGIAKVAKVARNVGEIDAWCRLITAVCGELGIPAHGISPKSKGAKIKEAAFIETTGWQGRSNEHTRDAAMVAWPYRRAVSLHRGAN